MDFGGIYSVVLLVSHTILPGCISNLSPFLLDCLHNRQMTPNNNRHAAKEPAPMAIPITSGGTNVVGSNFFLEILAADVAVIVVVLVGVDGVLVGRLSVVLVGRLFVVLLVGVAVVLLGRLSVVLLVGVVVVLVGRAAVVLFVGVAVLLLAGEAAVLLVVTEQL